MIRFVCSLVLLICFSLSALADVAPPPPAAGFKRVPYENVMKLETELPAYRFFKFQQLGLGGQATIEGELSLGTEKGIKVPSSSSPSVRTGVVAVSREMMDQLKTKENLSSLLARDKRDELPGGVVVYETRGTIRDLKKSDPRNKVVNVITVSEDKQAGVRFTAKETPPPSSTDASSDASTRSPWTILIAGIAASLAIAAAGVLYFRRK